MNVFVLSIVFCFLIVDSSGGKLPDYLESLLCKASDPEYEKCVWNGFENSRPYLIGGIREAELPPLDPFQLPILVVNRTLNEFVSIDAICRNIRIEGARNFKIEDLKADPIKHIGEIRVSLPWSYLEMEYDVTGRLLSIPLISKGFFKGNFTDIQMYVKGSLETYKREDDEYFRVKTLNSKLVVGNGWIKLIAKNPALQFSANLISNLYNNNPRQVMDAINPIFTETSNDLFRVVSNQILGNLKASEWLPA